MRTYWKATFLLGLSWSLDAQVPDLILKQSAERALSLLQRSGSEFVQTFGCISCHHQSLPQMAIALARGRSLSIDESSRKQVEPVVASLRSMREQALPDPPISISYALLGLAAEGYEPDSTTDAMVDLISRHQLRDGSFRAIVRIRPPLESSDFTATAMSLRALQLYGRNTNERVARAGEWLRAATASTTEDRAMQLLGMVWAKMRADDIREAALKLAAEQREDGGWSQLPSLESDAYATGETLVALNQAGYLATADPTYQQGIAFLLRTQFSDGSWLVRSRATAVRKFKQSTFPHGKDQFISAAGTSWAAMALTLALPSQQTGSNVPATLGSD